MSKRPRRAPPLSRRHAFTSELKADGRRRYEATAETITAIAVDFGVHKTTFQRLADREGWVRFAPPPRDLPAASKLAAQAAGALELATPPAGAAGAGQDPAAPPQGNASLIARLRAAVVAELAAVEAMRAQLRRTPQRPLDAAHTARTLASLTDTLHRLQRLQAAAPEDTHDIIANDLPADIDEFRLDLARRIDAFVASRTQQGDADERSDPVAAADAP